MILWRRAAAEAEEVVGPGRIAVDLVTEGYEVMVRLNPRPDSSLAGRCLAPDRLAIAAAPILARPTGAPGEMLPVVVRASLSNDAAWRVPGPDGPEVATRTVLDPAP